MTAVARRPRVAGLPVNPLEQTGEGGLFAADFLRRFFLAAHGGGGVREDLVAGVHDRFGDLGCQEVHHLAHDAQAGGDALGAPHDGVADHVRRLVGADRRHMVVELGGRDHRRAHQRHVDGGEMNPLVRHLAGGAAGERIQRRLGRHIGGEAGRVG